VAIFGAEHAPGDPSLDWDEPDASRATGNARSAEKRPGAQLAVVGGCDENKPQAAPALKGRSGAQRCCAFRLTVYFVRLRPITAEMLQEAHISGFRADRALAGFGPSSSPVGVKASSPSRLLASGRFRRIVSIGTFQHPV
jgi:hypothetical protein